MRTEEILLDAINDGLERNAEDGHRWHLGASLIGEDCARYLFYVFRWCKEERFPGRMLRLFDRGQREEERIIGWLRGAGVTVMDRDEHGDQIRVSDCSGHFGGSMDSELLLPPLPGLPEQLRGQFIIGEYKTHNDKSFQELKKKGVFSAKYRHWVQMQIYMRKRGRDWALYVAVNKNDDELYLEIVQLDARQADSYITRAQGIINAEEPPPRVSETPAFFRCKFCALSRVCHGNEVPEVNCRTCAHISPVENGGWHCARHDVTFYKPTADDNGETPESPMRRGCTEHVFNPHLLNGVELLGGTKDGRHSILRLKDGTEITQGPDHVKSSELVLP